jgi:hypothetical protein
VSAGGWRAGTAVGARTIVGAAVAVGVVVGVGAAVVAPWPTHGSPEVSVVADPVPADAVLACDGPILAAGRLADQAGVLSIAADATLTTGSTAGNTPEEVPVAVPDVTDSPGVPALISRVQGRDVPPLAGASSASVSAPDLRGLAADACRPALFDSWLVGGRATTGAADLVLIANPGEVAATVDITVYGTDGPVVPPGGESIAIPPRTQRVIPLSGLALGQAGPVVRVSAEGAPVRASLQSSLVQTLVPLGVDQQSAIAVPSSVQVVPNVVVTTPPGESGASDATTILRVLAPASDTTATVRVVPLDESGEVRGSTVPLTAGVPAELELGGLPLGRYAVVVESAVDAPTDLVAAVWQSAGNDFAWLTSSPPLTAPAPFAVASGPTSVLQVANPGTEDATVVLTPLSGDGEPRTLEVAAGTVERLQLPADSTWSLDSGGVAVHAGVTLSAEGAVAGYAVWSTDAATQPITVHP